MKAPRPIPTPDSRAAVFWQGARESRLLIQRCNACGHHQHYPRAFCLRCEGDDLTFEEASGKGTIYSFTIVQRSPYADLEAPYVLALVRLDNGVQLLTQLKTSAPEALCCDQPVEVEFERLREDFSIPVFRPSGAGARS